MDSDNIQSSIIDERQGNITGMYNILVYKQLVQQLDGDGITRIVQPPVPSFSTPRPQSSYESKPQPSFLQTTRRSEPVKSAPAHRNHVIKVKEALEIKLDYSTQQRPSTSSGKRTAEVLAPPSSEARAASATVGGRVYITPLLKCNPMTGKASYSPKEAHSIQSPLRVERPLTPVRLMYGNNEMKSPMLSKGADRNCTPQVT